MVGKHDLPPPPVSVGTPAHGLRAKHFQDVPTERLVSEMRKLWRQFGDVRAIQSELKRGRYTVL